jgi:hypothetical protein
MDFLRLHFAVNRLFNQVLIGLQSRRLKSFEPRSQSIRSINDIANDSQKDFEDYGHIIFEFFETARMLGMPNELFRMMS